MSKRRALDEVAARQRAADESDRKKPSGNRLRWLFNQRWFINFRPYIPSAYPALLGRVRSIAISDFVLLFFRGDCPSVATPQSQVGVIIPAALVL